jgi:hypothetical protein
VVIEIALRFDTPKVATSDNPFGIVFGVQFAALFQSPFAGLFIHVALPAKECRWAAARDSSAMAAKKVNLFGKLFMVKIVGS